MKVLDLTKRIQPKGANPKTQPSLRSIEMLSEPEGGRYCIHVHEMPQFIVMAARPDDQIEFYEFGAGATFFNDEDILDILLANPGVQRAIDLNQITLTDGKGYRILAHDTGQYVVDTGLQVGENNAIPVAYHGHIKGLDFGSKYLKGDNISALDKKHTIITGAHGTQSIPDIASGAFNVARQTTGAL